MRNKLKRFKEVEERFNVLQQGKERFETIKGKWLAEQFKNDNPLVVELACGYGEYSVGLARVNPDKNYVGVDIKGSRIWVGSSTAIEEGMENVAFLRTQILLVDRFFEDNEVDELWITFPDPRPRGRDEKRRLTYKRFIEIYKKMLKPEGWLQFKTDNTELFQYTLEELNKRSDIKNLTFTFDLYDREDLLPEHSGIKTRYEGIFTEKGEKIKYLKFQFDK